MTGEGKTVQEAGAAELPLHLDRGANARPSGEDIQTLVMRVRQKVAAPHGISPMWGMSTRGTAPLTQMQQA